MCDGMGAGAPCQLSQGDHDEIAFMHELVRDSEPMGGHSQISIGKYIKINLSRSPALAVLPSQAGFYIFQVFKEGRGRQCC